MVRMGCFNTEMRVENPSNRGEVREVPAALVDTGSEFSWIPRHLLEGLGVRVERTQRFVTANGSRIVRSVGFAIVHAAGVSTADDVVFAEPGDLTLLGARSLEGLNLHIDPQRKLLIPAGPAPAAVGG